MKRLFQTAGLALAALTLDPTVDPREPVIEEVDCTINECTLETFGQVEAVLTQHDLDIGRMTPLNLDVFAESGLPVLEALATGMPVEEVKANFSLLDDNQLYEMLDRVSRNGYVDFAATRVLIYVSEEGAPLEIEDRIRTGGLPGPLKAFYFYYLGI